MTPRDELIEVIARALGDEHRVRALWEAGSTAFGRNDEHSDVDLIAVVADGTTDAALALLDENLRAWSAVDVVWHVPRPTWHGHAQVFYRLERAGPLCLVDFVAAESSSSSSSWFLEPERHGTPRVLFDHDDLVAPARFDADAWADTIKERREQLRLRHGLFTHFVDKELARGNLLGARAAFDDFVLRPLHELLRTVHCPERYDYAWRYSHTDLPREIVTRLESLVFVGHTDDLRRKTVEARAWIDELLRSAS